MRVLVIGDTIIDKWIEIDEIKSIEQGEVAAHIKQSRQSPGAALLAALDLRAIGVEPSLVTILGDDFYRNVIFGYLYRNGVHVWDYGTSHTITHAKFWYWIQDENEPRLLFRADRYAKSAIGARDLEEQTLSIVEKASEGASAILVSDYGKGTITPAVMRLVCSQEIPVILDPYPGRDYGDVQVEIITPSHTDQVTGVSARATVRTVGEEGMILKSNQLQAHSVIFPGVKVGFPVVGAGDAVAACLAKEVAAKTRIETAVQRTAEIVGKACAKHRFGKNLQL